MRLKSIKIYGFKSFADRVDIDVDGNLVAVVGPNGCGKSNLVDAMMWALGELSPKNLRAESSADVIFSGSAKRRALGYAEVVLTFDNEAGVLPIPTTEVTIGRKVDRKGDSHFTINGQACRLRDIFELFADTGLGRTGYAIVSQNDIDAALNANAEERRTWLDEAAGVQRYRSRKMEALKRLDSAVTHLQRVNDVIAEIETQREPLEQEAIAARAYKEKVGALREVESGLLIVEAARYRENIERLSESVAQKHSAARAMRAEAEELDRSSREHRREAEALEEELDRISLKLQRELTQAERAQSRKQIAEQRLRSLEELDESRETEQQANEQRVSRSKRALETVKRELEEAEAAIRVLLQVISGSEGEAQRLRAQLEDAESKLLEARTSEVRNIEAQAKAEHLKERKRLLAREMDGAVHALPALKEGATAAEEAVAVAESELIKARDKRNQLENAHAEAHTRLSFIEQEKRTLLTHAARLEGHMQGLRATLESFAGLPHGARSVMEASKAGRLDGDFLPVGSAVSAPSNLARAIESALGASTGDLITSSSAHAKRAIAYLSEEGLGRATFLAKDLVAMRARPNEIESLKSEPGVLGIAADLIQFDREHRFAVEMLLGGVLIAENIESATRLAKRNGYRKIATLNGEVLFSGGALTGGKSARQTAGQIQTVAELDDCERERHALSKQIEEIDAQSQAVAKEEADHAGSVVRLLDEIKHLEQRVSEAVHWHTSVRQELQATERTVERLGSELAEIESVLTSGDRKAAEGEVSVQALEADRNELLTLAASKSADVAQARRALQEAEDRVEQARERVRHSETELEEAKRAAESRERRFSGYEDEKEAQLKAIEEADREAKEFEKSHASTEAELSSLRSKKRELQQSAQKSAEEANELRSSALAVDDAAYQEDIQRARQETRLAASLARLLEEYGTSEEEAGAQAKFVVLPPDAEKVVGQLRREVRAFGDVNVGAIEAYERLTERYDILFSQREDILASKEELDRSVAELDKITRGAFKETFEKVQSAFGEMFTRLFDGGEARLELTQPERLLDSGVDIHVQVPGKKTQRLELLSGGERALSACAFLFALFKVKPSPVCVLDELDAPLDGRNVERYVDLLKEFAQESQFIVITHNPTTIEASPVWFGITMQEPGVSSILPYRTSSTGNGTTHLTSEEKVTVR